MISPKSFVIASNEFKSASESTLLFGRSYVSTVFAPSANNSSIVIFSSVPLSICVHINIKLFASSFVITLLSAEDVRPSLILFSKDDLLKVPVMPSFCGDSSLDANLVDFSPLISADLNILVHLKPALLTALLKSSTVVF